MTGSHGARRDPGRQMIRPAVLAGAGPPAPHRGRLHRGAGAHDGGVPPVLKDKAWGDVLDDVGTRYAAWAQPGF
jgi:hypothetical protein